MQRYTVSTNVDVGVAKELLLTNCRSFIRFIAQYTGQYVLFCVRMVHQEVRKPTAQIFSMVNNSGYIIDYTRDVVSNLTLTYKLDKSDKGAYGQRQTNLSSVWCQ